MRKRLRTLLLRCLAALFGVVQFPLFQILWIRPGDILVLRTEAQLSPQQSKHYRDALRTRIGEDIPVAFVDGDWQLYIWRQIPPPGERS